MSTNQPTSLSTSLSTPAAAYGVAQGANDRDVHEPVRHAVHQRADRAAAAALLAGSLAGVVVMALHPTGRDAVRTAAAGAPNTLLTAVHVVALVVQPLVLAGTLALTRRLRAARAGSLAGAAAVAATVYFALASVATLAAAVASGFVAPRTLGGFAEAGAPERAAMLSALAYTGHLNQSFARLAVLLTGMAVLLWSAAMLAARGAPGRVITPAWPRLLAWSGLALGAALAAGAGSGHLRMDVHGFGLAVLGQALWLTGVAARLWRTNAAAAP